MGCWGSREGGNQERAGKNQEMPTFSGLLRGHLKPSSRRSGGSCCKTFPVALHESSAKRVSPSLFHPRLAAAASEPELSVAQTSPLGPAAARPSPPRPADPFKPPGLEVAAPGGNAGQDWGPDDKAPSRAVVGRPVR